MKFLKLQVENFMAIASAEVELDQRGLVLIQGVNSGDTSAASNGAGKSTLMNSLMWCLYGETAHGVKGDDVLSTGHEKNCRVMVTVEDEGKKYAIIRHRKHKEFKNRLIVRGEDGDMTKGKDTLTQTFVERLIGASKEVFMASIYASQEAMPDLPGMSDKSLKTIVEEAAGVDRLTRAEPMPLPASVLMQLPHVWTLPNPKWTPVSRLSRLHSQRLRRPKRPLKAGSAIAASVWTRPEPIWLARR